MFWYWYILVTNFVFGILVIVLIGKERERQTSGMVAFGILIMAIETFAFWRVHDNKLVGIPIAVTIYAIISSIIALNSIDKMPRARIWTLQRVLFTTALNTATIVAAVVLQRAN
jgi:hypothetical protein